MEEIRKKDIIRLKTEISRFKDCLEVEKFQKSEMENKMDVYLNKERRALLKLNENSKIQELNDRLQAQRDELFTELSRAQEEIYCFKSKNQKLQEKLTEFSGLQKENKILSEKLAKIEKHFAYDFIDNDKLSLEKKEAENENKKNLNSIKFKETEISILNKKVSDLEDTKRDLTEANCGLEAKTLDLGSKKRELLQELINLEAETEKAIQNLQYKLSLSENENRNLRYELEKTLRELNVVRDEIQSRDALLNGSRESELGKQVAALKKEVFCGKETKKQLESDIAKLERQIDDQNCKIDTLQKFEELFRGEANRISDFEFTIINLKNQIMKHEKTIEYYMSLEEKKDASIKKWHEDQARLLKKIESLKLKKKTLQDLISDRDWEIKTLKKSHSEWESKNEQLLKDHSKRFEDLKSRLASEQEKMLTDHKKQLDDLINSDNAKEKKICELQKAIKDQEDFYENKIRVIVTHNNNDKDKEIDALLKLHTTRLDNEIAGYKQEISERDFRITRL
jgi:chromosome segregation ATPase